MKQEDSRKAPQIVNRNEKIIKSKTFRWHMPFIGELPMSKYNKVLC
jgi:hypothetical protein